MAVVQLELVGAGSNALRCSTLIWRPMPLREGISIITGTEPEWIFFASRPRERFIASYPARTRSRNYQAGIN
jgi:hypothetical protein